MSLFMWLYYRKCLLNFRRLTSIRKLKKQAFEAYFVGDCSRCPLNHLSTMILVTSSYPEETKLDFFQVNIDTEQA